MWKKVADGHPDSYLWVELSPPHSYNMDIPKEFMNGSGLRGVASNVLNGTGNAPNQLPFREMERIEPIRPYSIEADVSVHFLRSLISGFFALIAVSALVLITYNWDEGVEVISWKFIPILFVLVMCADWFGGRAGSERFLMKVERITGLDINGDGNVGAPPSTVRIEVTEHRENGGRIKYVDFPVKDIILQEFLTGLLEYGMPLSRPTWVGEGKLLTRGKYEAILEILLTEKWAYMIKPGSPTAGYALTVAGKTLLRQTLENMK